MTASFIWPKSTLVIGRIVFLFVFILDASNLARDVREKHGKRSSRPSATKRWRKSSCERRRAAAARKECGGWTHGLLTGSHSSFAHAAHGAVCPLQDSYRNNGLRIRLRWNLKAGRPGAHPHPSGSNLNFCSVFGSSYVFRCFSCDCIWFLTLWSLSSDFSPGWIFLISDKHDQWSYFVLSSICVTEFWILTAKKREE